MHYNADSYLAGLEPPTYTHHQCVYYGRHLSFDQWAALLRHLELLDDMLRRAATLDQLRAAKSYVQFRMAMRRIVDAVFPKRCRVDVPSGASLPRRGWIVTRPARVSELIEELPLAAQCAAVEGFTRSQERLQQARAAARETTTMPPPNATGSEPTTTTDPTPEGPTT